MNEEVGRETVEGVLERWRVPAKVDENGSTSLGVCAGRGLVVANTFWHKMAHM